VGRDSLGPIDILRRYSEFLMLKDMLFSRYPGIVIPPIPSKKITGKLENTIISERKYFLDLFLKDICSASYLAQSPEL
jgi:sorting nexin-1/2